ncbi:MAG TPA: beta-hydroxyacyl-ACP dehydratase [Gemmataceae bacterium]|nr:beta-hydroxyacyl-ACP dehydratase [Gemmataceae bacterium]
MPPPLILDPTTIDLTRVVADREAIRKANPHRGHMEHLTAVVLMDPGEHLIAGYKDVGHDEFWVAGHFPNRPLLPGVIQCEAAAQLLGYYLVVNQIMSGLLGLGGLDNARFRGPVHPGDRLVMVGKGLRVNRRQTVFHAQGFVNANMVFHCDVMGLPITRSDLAC